MNFSEAIELLEAVSDFQFEPLEKKPNFCIYDNQNEGYTLNIKATSVSEEYLKFVKQIAEKWKFKMRKSGGYLIIYGP